MSIPIRARLTLWYVGVLVLILIAFSAGVLWLQGRYSRAQFDTELASVAMTVSGTLRAELAGDHPLALAAADTRRIVDIPNRTVAILDGNGQPLAAHWRGFHSASFPRPAMSPVVTTTIWQGAAPWRVRLQREESAKGPFMIFVAATETPLVREQIMLARTLLVGTPIALLCSALVCWWVASRALAPLTQMSADAERITVHSLVAGLPVRDADDEVGQLGRAFNRLLTRVGAAVTTQRQFMADASHELRTPVTAARIAAEVTLGVTHRDETEYRDALDVVRAQTRRLGRMVDDMLVLARMDAGGYPLRAADCDAAEILGGCEETAAVLASARGVALDASLLADVPLYGDEAMLRQMALNLLENAIKHTPAGGRVSLTLRVAAGRAEIRITDTGCGIPATDAERIFGRFVRLDRARETSGGAGLGLPIARWIAESHGGALTLEGSSPSGSTFLACLPLRPVTARASAAATSRNCDRYARRVAGSKPIVTSDAT
jgi:signal transduction histidine kinase